jgi:hypothetical protein
MFLKKIPPINIVLFVLLVGVVGASIYGMVQYADDPDNNYVESTYNASLSHHYTDSFSRTPVAALGKIEISIYDSVENRSKPFVLCRITNNQKILTWREIKKQALTAFLAVFPIETWMGEFNYQIKQPSYFRSITTALHPIQLELNNTQDDDDWD